MLTTPSLKSDMSYILSVEVLSQGFCISGGSLCSGMPPGMSRHCVLLAVACHADYHNFRMLRARKILGIMKHRKEKK